MTGQIRLDRRRGRMRGEFIDPDGFTLSQLIFAALNCATGIFVAVEMVSGGRREEKRRRLRRLTAAVRWEGELLELQGLLIQIAHFVRDVLEQQEPQSMRRQVRPLDNLLCLTHPQFRAYRQLVNSLLEVTRRLHETSSELLSYIERAELSQYLRESVLDVRKLLRELGEGPPLTQGIEGAQELTNRLLKVAEYIRADLLA